ncbi:hypothetical protein GCM10027563_08920 [Parasphingorhabdus pacifica]
MRSLAGLRFVVGPHRRQREAHPTEAKAVQAVAKQAAGGLKFHDLRHSCATWLVDDGMPVNMVQRVLGHERSSTTLDLYTRRRDGGDRILEARFEAMTTIRAEFLRRTRDDRMLGPGLLTEKERPWSDLRVEL